MNKQKLIRFIDKYHLSGLAESVVLDSNLDNKTLTTKFVTENKSLLGVVKLENWDFEDANIGVYTTSQLLKLLSILDEDIRVDITKSGEKALSMSVSDSASSVNYMLSDSSIINEPPPMKNIPEFEVKINLNPSFIGRFIAGKSALPETTTFTVITKDGNTNLVIGYSSVNTNRVNLPAEVEEYNEIENVSFNAEYFSNILSANKECETGTLEISSQGLAKLTFKVDDYSSMYYLVATTEVD
mgnify:CR=1 FL=1